MAYEYSMPLLHRAAMRVFPLLAVAAGVFILMFEQHRGLAICVFFMYAALAVATFLALCKIPLHVCVTRDKVLIRRMRGDSSCSRQDIFGVEVDVPCELYRVQTRIHFKSQRRFVSISERWKTPRTVREVESGEERILSSLLLEWFGAYRPGTDAEEADCGHSLHGLSRSIDFRSSLPAKGVGGLCFILVYAAIGASVCVYYARLGNLGLAIPPLAMCMFVFGIFLFVLLWRTLEIRVKQDEVQVRTFLGWKSHLRADILGVEKGVPVGRELFRTTVHLKKRYSSFSFLERWSKPTMARHAETGEEIELTPLLVELFGTHTPERKHDASSTGQRS